MIILSIRLFFSIARRMNPEGLPQLSEACLYSNPPLLLSLRVFLTPPSFGHLPYILRCKTQGRRVTLCSSQCDTPHTGHGKGGLWYKGLSFPAKESPCYTNLRYLFILLNSEKNEPRSAAAVIGLLGSSPQSPSGSAELASLGQSSPFFLRLPCDFTAR